VTEAQGEFEEHSLVMFMVQFRKGLATEESSQCILSLGGARADLCTISHMPAPSYCTLNTMLRRAPADMANGIGYRLLPIHPIVSETLD
jgi:hypothetical protein